MRVVIRILEKENINDFWVIKEGREDELCFRGNERTG